MNLLREFTDNVRAETAGVGAVFEISLAAQTEREWWCRMDGFPNMSDDR